MRPTPMRAAFSMITAIFVIVLMASVAAFVMNLSGKVVQETTAQYRKEQAILYAKSYTEFAIMAATAQDCAPAEITAEIGNDTEQGDGYHIIVQTHYIGANSGCPNTIRLGNADNVNTPSSVGGVILVDVFVRYRNPEDENAINNEDWSMRNRRGITYHRRTLQRL